MRAEVRGSGGLKRLPSMHYEGEFRDGKRHGRGAYTWPDGSRYEGGFRDGVLHGRGVMTKPDGTRQEGEWRDGVFVAE